MTVCVLVAPGLARLERALVLELAEVHELAHRRAGHRCNFDQIQIDVRGQLEGLLQRDDAHLLTLGADQSDLGHADLLVDAWFDADGASLVVPVLVVVRGAGAERPRCGDAHGARSLPTSPQSDAYASPRHRGR